MIIISVIKIISIIFIIISITITLIIIIKQEDTSSKNSHSCPTFLDVVFLVAVLNVWSHSTQEVLDLMLKKTVLASRSCVSLCLACLSVSRSVSLYVDLCFVSGCLHAGVSVLAPLARVPTRVWVSCICRQFKPPGRSKPMERQDDANVVMCPGFKLASPCRLRCPIRRIWSGPLKDTFKFATYHFHQLIQSKTGGCLDEEVESIKARCLFVSFSTNQDAQKEDPDPFPPFPQPSTKPAQQREDQPGPGGRRGAGLRQDAGLRGAAAAAGGGLARHGRRKWAGLGPKGLIGKVVERLVRLCFSGWVKKDHQLAPIVPGWFKPKLGCVKGQRDGDNNPPDWWPWNPQGAS